MATLHVPAPNELDLSPEGLRGYWFETPFRMGVPAGDPADPVVFEMHTMRAGAIAGSILEADGEAASNVNIRVFETKQSMQTAKRSSLNVEVKNNSWSEDERNEFLASPLPLEDTYVIAAYRDYTYVLSDPIEMTEADPVRQIRLSMPEGQAVFGKILDARGEPVAMAKTRFRFEPDAGYGFTRPGPQTDRHGKFRIDGLNAGVAGTYWIIVDSVPGHQPAKHLIRFWSFWKSEQTIRLESGHVLRGVVREAGSGKVVPGATVYAMRAEKNEKDAIPRRFETEPTNGRGEFEFTDLPKGDFRIASHSGKMVSGEAVGRSGEGDLVELVIEPYEFVPVDAE